MALAISAFHQVVYLIIVMTEKSSGRGSDLIILHAGQIERQLFLWGESIPDTGQAPQEPKSRRRAALRQAEPHPLDATFESLVAILTLVSSVIPAPTPLVQPAAVWLPSVGSRPLPSSAIIDETVATATAKAQLQAWRVTAIGLSATM